jgi:uncharacterized protein (TIGR02145 family)
MMKTPRFLLAACILLALALTFSCSDDDGDFLAKLPPEPEYCIDFVEGTEIEHFGMKKKQFCDPRDGNLYVKVTIGTQTWMAEDLNYNMYNSQCYYGSQYNEEGEEIGCETSRRYDWRGARGACPIGWRLPTIDDLNTLVNYVGASESEIKLKATSGWPEFPDYTNGNGTDDYGFSALSSALPYSLSGLRVPWNYSSIEGHKGTSMRSVRCLLGDDNGTSEPYRDIDLVATRSTPMTDKRDGRYKEYKTVTITTKTGTLTWMAQNLNYAVEGSKCGFEIDTPAWETPAWEVVDENTPYCDTYGRFYNWNTAINACPAGWRLPSKEEFASLGFNIIKLKATSGWDYKNLNGTDDYGLALLPCGYTLERDDGSFSFNGSIKSVGRWWSSSEYETNINNAYSLYIGPTADHTDAYPRLEPVNMSRTYTSVRCVKE